MYVCSSRYACRPPGHNTVAVLLSVCARQHTHSHTLIHTLTHHTHTHTHSLTHTCRQWKGDQHGQFSAEFTGHLRGYRGGNATRSQLESGKEQRPLSPHGPGGSSPSPHISEHRQEQCWWQAAGGEGRWKHGQWRH